MARMGSRERMQRAALEKELEAKEKAELAEAGKASKTGSTSRAPRKTAAAATGRVKMVWQVYDVSMKQVAVFPYPQRAQAEARAAELTESKGKEYGVRSVQVPMD